MKVGWLLFICLFCRLLMANPIGELNDDAYKKIRAISLKIIGFCPPEECIVLGIGRSPTPITSFLSIITPTTLTLPLSRFRYHINKNRGYEVLEAEDLSRLEKHFDRYLPLEKIGKKRIVLVDYAVSGKSLFSTETFIRRHLQSHGMKNEIYSLALTTNETLLRSHALDFEIRQFGTISLSMKNFLDNMFRAQRFDQYAEYGSAGFGSWGKEISESTSLRNDFLQKIKEHMGNDPQLRAFFKGSKRSLEIHPKTLGGVEIINNINQFRWLTFRANCLDKVRLFH